MLVEGGSGPFSANQVDNLSCEGSVGRIKQFSGPHLAPGPLFAHLRDGL